MTAINYGPDKTNPSYYKSHPSGVECITITEHMSFTLGNAMKYIWRADMKNGIEDLEKASWYLAREIALRKGKQNVHSTINQPIPDDLSAAVRDSWTRHLDKQVGKDANDSRIPGTRNISGGSPPSFCEHGEQLVGSVRDAAPIKTRCVTDGL